MCLKCTILVTNFQKSLSAVASPPPAPRNLQYLLIWSSVIWPNCVFLSWLWWNPTLKIVMTPFQWRHHHYVTKKYQNNVTYLVTIKIFGYASASAGDSSLKRRVVTAIYCYTTKLTSLALIHLTYRPKTIYNYQGRSQLKNNSPSWRNRAI